MPNNIFFDIRFYSKSFALLPVSIGDDI